MAAPVVAVLAAAVEAGDFPSQEECMGKTSIRLPTRRVAKVAAMLAVGVAVMRAAGDIWPPVGGRV